MLKKENDFLHSASSLSRQTSHSISPTPASFSSEKSAQAEFLFNLPAVCLQIRLSAVYNIQLHGRSDEIFPIYFI